MTRVTTFVAAAAGLAAAAHADIAGFDSLNTWAVNVAPLDTAPPINIPDADTVVLTTGGGNLRSIWHEVPQTIADGFIAEFTYGANRATGSSGLSFVLQNDPRGLDAIGSSNSSNGFPGIDSSFAVAFNYNFFDTETGVGIGRNGSIANSEAMSPVSTAGRDVAFRITYDGDDRLSLVATDVLDPSLTFARSYILSESIAETIGAGSAIVGFGAGTNGGPPGLTQTLSDFSFVVVPAPASLATLGLAGVLAARRRR